MPQAALAWKQEEEGIVNIYGTSLCVRQFSALPLEPS